MSSLSPQPREFIEAHVNYLLDTGVRPINYATEPPAGVPRQTGQALSVQVRIANGRLEAEPPTLDRHGFELRAHRSAVSDFSDEKLLRDVYYREAQALIKQVTGAADVVIFDHTLRYALPGHAEPGVREPAKRVHNDQTFVSGPRRVRDHLPVELAEARLKKRHGIINLWRPIGGPVKTWPLALCDARTIDPADLIPTDLVYADKVGETYSFVPNPRHRWIYFPDLRPDEVLLLKIFDSSTDGKVRLTAHTAFDDPTSPADAPPRRSIELRTLVFWE